MSPRASAPRTPRVPRHWRRHLLAVTCGGLTGLAWQPANLWPLAVLGVAALTLLVTYSPQGQPGLRSSFATGWFFGLGLCTVSIVWVSVIGWYVAPPLVAFMALWQGLVGLVVAASWRLSSNPLVRAVLAATGWSLAEFGACRVPFGGFGWIRLAYSQVDSPLGGWLPLVGVAGTSLAVALSGTLLAVAVNRTVARTARLAAIGAIILLWGLVPLVSRFPAGPDGRNVTVGIVQGNVDGSGGPEAMGYARSVTVNHVSQTVDLMARARAGLLPKPDFVLWPENSTDVDPAHDQVTRDLIMAASQLADVPVLIGAVTRGPGADERQTTAIWWPTDGVPGARYEKRNLVPFGEWIPLRQQLLPLFPILEQVGPQSVPGTSPGVLHVDLPDGRPLVIGDVICFELAWDDTVRDTVTNGARILVSQSNTGTYTGTWQPQQQFAITRARAMELRREVVVSTTNSISGLVHADGSVEDLTKEATAASRSVIVPERTALTPAVRVAPLLELAASALASVALLGICWDFVRRGRGAPRRQ